MALELKLSQKLSQSLVMTPQLRQAIKLLQLGRAEFSEVLENELLENPLLEDGRDFEVESKDSLATQTKDDWSQVGSSSPYQNSNLEQQIESPEGLSSHIMWQLKSLGLSRTEQTIAEHIIGNLDRNGYLRQSVSELASALEGVSHCEVEEVLSYFHTLDPAGIGARNLEECLLIQLQQLGMHDTLCYRMVQNHLTLVEANDFQKISKLENTSMENVSAAVAELRRLEPYPGRQYNHEPAVYITPDIYVKRNGGKLELSLNDRGVPKLRLNPYYQKMFTSGLGEADAFFQERFKSATWLLRSIEQRQKTIFRVTESIFRHHGEFLEKGVAGLKPLVLREVAADLGLHESTISRVTSNKYVHTPQGIYELKFFFSSGLRGANGDVSSETVKKRIATMISEENPERPLSDEAISKKLKQEGTKVARRTVAKYREALNISSSTKRKKRI